MSLNDLLNDVRRCQICAQYLPLGPRPVLQAEATAKILIAGQAPGRKAHESGVPFDDVSGDRLRGWLGMPREVFYDPRFVAVVPMGFCFPGTGSSGDLPPRRECEPAWRAPLLAGMPELKLTLVLGKYAQDYHLGADGSSVSARVEAWREHWPDVVPLPHPSPRNNLWLRRHPWFERDLLPALRTKVQQLLAETS